MCTARVGKNICIFERLHFFFSSNKYLLQIIQESRYSRVILHAASIYKSKIKELIETEVDSPRDDIKEIEKEEEIKVIREREGFPIQMRSKINREKTMGMPTALRKLLNAIETRYSAYAGLAIRDASR